MTREQALEAALNELLLSVDARGPRAVVLDGLNIAKQQARAALALPPDNSDMLAALKVAEKAIDDCVNFRSHLNYDARDVARAAIAKAEGGTL